MSGYNDGLIEYFPGQAVRAFSTMRDAVLPCPVTVGRQVHGCDVAVVDRMGMSREELDGYDALITDLRGCAIGVRTADCIPVLLYDPVGGVVAAIHAGWKGTVQKICLNAVRKMAEHFGTRPADLVAEIGPGISLRSFQVGEEVPRLFREAGFPIERIWRWDGPPEKSTMKGGHHIDLIEANRWLLAETGVRPENIRSTDICTYEDARFFSARREGIGCGRIISAIELI